MALNYNNNLKETLGVEGTSKAGQWVDEAGNIKWPMNDGFAGTAENITLKPGTRIDRYGYEGGTFVSPEGIPEVISTRY